VDGKVTRINGKHPTRGVVLRSALEIAMRPARANWLLRPLIPRGALVLMYGAEGTYKSFLALDWALQIAKAGEQAVFLHAEGRGLWKRLRAWALHNYPGQPWSETLNGLPFLAVERPLNLSADSVLLELTEAINEIGRKPGLVVVDTISRNSDGSVERSNEDANMYLNRLDQGIRAPYGASVVLVHHVGHAARDRARGPFTLTGSTDANFRLERPDLTRRTVNVISGRMKDCEPPEPFELQAEIVTLDEIDEEGKPETSLVLGATGTAPVALRYEPKGRNQQLLLGALREHVRANGSDLVSTPDLHAIGRAQGLSRKRLPEARQALERDGWIAESVGGVRLLESRA
jgi:KaiC/GvpD/RAD55 family RecA-like ATPase